jgi:hypothetical protein
MPTLKVRPDKKILEPGEQGTSDFTDFCQFFQ